MPFAAMLLLERYTNIRPPTAIREAGKPLLRLPPDFPLATLCSLGSGAYVVADGTVYVAASGDHDPGTSGRRYTMESTISFSRSLLVVTCATLILLGRRTLACIAARTAGTALTDHATLMLLMFACAALARIIHLITSPRLTFGLVSVVGVPFSDAQVWYDLAVSIATGHGVTGPFRGRTLVFPYLMATVITWFGSSWLIPKILNIVADAVSAALIYRILDKAFHRWLAIAVALVFSLSPVALNYSLTIMREPVGLCLLVVALSCISRGCETTRASWLFAGGVCLALSNLSRPLTLFAVPGLAGCVVWWSRRDRLGWRRTMALGAVFVLGVALPLGPWLVRQTMAVGILSIEDATASALYAATTPAFGGTWTADTDREAREHGLHSIQERHEYFMAKAWDNVRSDPGFFVSNVVFTFHRFLNLLDRNDPSVANAYVLFMLGLLAAAVTRVRDIAAGIKLALCWGGVVLAHYALSPALSGVFIVGGVLLAFTAGARHVSALLAVILGFSGLALGLVGGAAMDRYTLLVQWIFAAYYLYVFLFVFRVLTEAVGTESTAPAVLGEPPRPVRWLRHVAVGARLAIIGVACFIGASSVRIAWLTFFRATAPGDSVAAIRDVDAQRLVTRVRAIQPALIDEAELDRPSAFARSVPFKDQPANHGKLFVGRCSVSDYLYRLGPDEQIPHWSRLFEPRPYERTAVYCREGYYVMIPGVVPPLLRRTAVVVVGRQNVSGREAFEGRIITEAVAWVPSGADEPIVMDSAMHASVLRSLKRA